MTAIILRHSFANPFWWGWQKVLVGGANTTLFIAEWPDGEITRMSVHGDRDLPRAVRVSFAAYDSRMKGKASRNITIKSGRVLEQPDKEITDLDVDSYFRMRGGPA